MADIIVDTYKLNQYAQRIASVNKRINNLDRRLDSLYKRVGLVDLWNLMKADILTGYSWRLARCEQYLQQTASDFENVESLLAEQDSSKFKINGWSIVDGDRWHVTDNHGPIIDLKEALKKIKFKIPDKTNSNKTTEYDLDNDDIKNIFKSGSGFSKLIYKWFKDKACADEFKISSSILSYVSSLYTFVTTEYSDWGELISGGMKFTNASTKMFDGVYNYLEGNLKPLDASRFGKKYQSGVKTISLIGNIFGFTGSSIEAARTFFDIDSTGYDKFHSATSVADSGLNLTESIVNLKYGQKVLTRDIHARYQYGVDAKNVKLLDKCATGIALGNVILGVADGAVFKYEQLSADGVVNSSDRAEIAINGSVKGLTKIVSFFTAGISDAMGLSEQSDEISDSLVNFARTEGVAYVENHSYSSNYAKNAYWMIEYANDESNPLGLRILSESTAGLGMIGAITVDGVGDGLKWIGNGITSGWNSLANAFN